MDAYRCIMTKRDLRLYTGAAIERPHLLQILEAGRRTGSARNRQPWEFVVVTDAAALAALARCGRFAGHLARAAAGIVLLVEAPWALFDAGRCAQNMMLAAWSLGVASCPIGLSDDRGVRRLLHLPEGRVVATTIALGYPDPRGRSRAERLALAVVAQRGRKPLEMLVHWGQYGAV
jgi:nitroreductase